MPKPRVERSAAPTPSAPHEDARPPLSILHTVVDCVVGINAASSLDEAVPQALAEIGRVLGVERVLVLQDEGKDGAAPDLFPRYQWTPPGVAPVDRALLNGFVSGNPDIVEWQAPLRRRHRRDPAPRGKPVRRRLPAGSGRGVRGPA